MEKIEFGVVTEQKTCKIVSDAAIARKLLKDGYRIVDIKPKRNHERETTFVFANEGDFMETMGKYIQERKEKVEKKEEE